jgi:hypothetical protein
MRAGGVSAARALFAATSALCLIAPIASTQIVRDEFWVVQGGVNAIVPYGNTIFLGGGFARVGPASGGGVPLSSATGAWSPAIYPKVAGSVWAVVSDGAGGWYVGGWFNAIGGVARHNLGHILADGSVDPWDPSPHGQVLGLARSGSRVYAASAGAIIALDATTGLPPVGWNPTFGSGAYSIATDGTNVYVGGFGGVFEALDGTTGAQVWTQPVTGSGPTVYALALDGPTLYVGGRFTGLSGQPRNRIGAVVAATGVATAWDPNSNGNVMALALSGSTVYAGGGFTSIGGQPRSRIAALDATTGAASSWDPNASAIIYALAADGSAVYAGGAFTAIGGQSRERLAALDATSGAATSWDPKPTNDVRALAQGGSTVYAGGIFALMGNWIVRRNLMALDAATGRATDWNPDVDGSVGALVLDGSTLYVGGGFTTIGGQARSNLAALDITTATPTAWNPIATGGGVYTLVKSGSTIYAGGDFTAVGGQVRNRIAAVDAATGAATAWNPNANNSVPHLAVVGNTVYAEGLFTNIGGQPRNWLAALDAATGAATTWNANPSGDVLYLQTMIADESAVYAGGRFQNIGGLPRDNIAALDPATASATAWDPGSDYDVDAIAIDGSTIYVGGNFPTISGQLRYGLAALDATTGGATAWNPNPTNDDATIGTIVVSGGTVYVGGSFDNIGNRPQFGFAAITQGTVDVPRRPVTSTLELAQNRPNPARSGTLIDFTLPQTAPVRLAVFDLLGRRVASLLEGEMRPAGSNRVRFQPAGLAGGLYLYRLEALGRTVTRKMIVVE